MNKITRVLIASIAAASSVLAIMAFAPFGREAAAKSAASDSDWVTYYEKSDCKATPRYDETIAYCKRLAETSPWIKYTSFGTSPQGRELPLLIADRDGVFLPKSVHSKDKVVLLVQACIHSGECDGKDAGLMLFRDIAVTKKYPKLIDHVTFLFIPIFNVDGHEHFGPYNRINQNGPVEMGWRVTAQDLNLNRDYLKADCPEMQAWLRLFTSWLPDFFVDCHVTDGADYQYAVTYGLDIFGSMAPALTHWTRDLYLERLKKSMEKAGFPISPYVYFRRRHDPASGLVTWMTPPRFSHGYATIQNRPGLLIETLMLKDYKTRVTGTYEMLKETLVLLNQEHKSLRKAVDGADAYTSSSEFAEKPFALQYRPKPDSVMIDFLGVEYKRVKSDLTGGEWFQWSDKPATYKIPYFNKFEPSVVTRIPSAYIIPTQWTTVIERLALHGVKFQRLSSPATLVVSSYRFDNLKWQERPFEGRHTLRFDVEPVEETRTFPAGSAVVPMDQRAARVAIHILEPEAPDALVRWGFMDAIFEQKEYSEDYVMEKMAREMLAADPELKKEFEKKKASDKEFSKNPRLILNWFYMHTPFWDKRINVYPVGKIMDRKILETLPLSG